MGLQKFQVPKKRKISRHEVSILGPLGYGPNTLPLRHAAFVCYTMLMWIYLTYEECFYSHRAVKYVILVLVALLDAGLSGYTGTV